WRGIVGVSALSAVIAVVDFIIAAWLGRRLLGGGYFEYVQHLGPGLLAATAAAAAAVVALHLAPAPHRLFPFLLAGVIMVLLYVIICWFIDPLFRRGALHLMKRLAVSRFRFLASG
ncbi:MAG: hypothetical protein GXP42_19275, partial [Chloroflexi bacterium]|nr:hypothetical protein [Chloroflexota bacterium]